ncbi:MAG: glycerophosphodiester phosphodiesterase family protein [Erythrobacter sp.]
MRSLLSRLDRFLAPPPDPARVGWLREWTYAHRGLHGPGVPENSIAAFAGAVERGMGIECDIQRSRDGIAMLVHDWELDRLTGVSGPLSDHSADELAQISFLDSEHKLARLEDLLELVAGKVPLLIEIKSRRRYDVEKSCAAVRGALSTYSGPCGVMSFDPRVSRWFRRNAPDVVQGLVMREDAKGHTQTAFSRRLALAIARPDFLAYHIAALPNAMVEGLRKSGLPILTWTVNSPELLERARHHADAPIAEGEGVR